MNIPLFDLRTQNKYFKKDLTKIFNTICTTASFIKGPLLEKFEEDFARFVGTKYCIGVASGTDALHLSLMALGIKKGDEVIIPVNTFVATAYAVLYVGAKPVVVDIDEHTYNINIDLIEKAITKKTKAIIPVHLYGNPAEMERINQLAQKYKLFVVEDACQAHGAMYHKKHAGNLGDLAAFSFYPSKNLGAYGDGGAITTNSLALAKKLKKLREYGATAKYVFEEVGLNSRLDTLQAAILSMKLQYLERWNAKKRELAKYYDKQFNKELPFIITPHVNDSAISAYHLYVIRTPKRNQLSKYLAEKGIQTGIYYPIPLHLQKSLKDLGYKKGDFSIVESITDEILCLPIYPELTKQKQNYIIQMIKSFFKK